MAGRVVSIGKALNRELKGTTSLTEDCLVLSVGADSKVDRCDAALRPYAIAYTSTVDRLSMTIGNEVFKTGAQLNDPIAVFRSGLVNVPLDVNHGAINVGDMLIVGGSGDGRVGKGNPGTATEFARRVGWAEEKVAAPSSNTSRTKATILVALDIRGGAP